MKKVIVSFLIFFCVSPLFGRAQNNCNLNISGTVNPVSCSGGMDGSVHLQVSGGVSSYSFSWSNGQEMKDINQLTEGSYVVTVRDANGCVRKKKFIVESGNKEKLNLRVEQQDVGNKMKVLDIVFQNGSKPYAVNIKKLSDGIRAPQLSYMGQHLATGTYLIEAFTEAGCSAMQKVVIDAN